MGCLVPDRPYSRETGALQCPGSRTGKGLIEEQPPVRIELQMTSNEFKSLDLTGHLGMLDQPM
jgi:hypothetical protein